MSNYHLQLNYKSHLLSKQILFNSKTVLDWSSPSTTTNTLKRVVLSFLLKKSLSLEELSDFYYCIMSFKVVIDKLSQP